MSLKERFAEAWTEARRVHRAGGSGARAAEAHAEMVDAIVAGLFADALPATGGREAGVALLAVGGYGRGELLPGSDLDLLLLHRGWALADVEALTRGVTYPLWDAGREVGHRVRDPKEALSSLGEVEEAAAILDARLLAGDRGLYREFQADVVRILQRGRAAFFRALAAATAERHTRHGHAGHLLEPDIRDAAGGLRDLHTLGWAAALLSGDRSLRTLEESGAMSAEDRAALEAAHGFLLEVRIESHLLAGRREDRLYLENQDDLGRRLGFTRSDGAEAGDGLMQEIYRHARGVEAVVTAVWERLAKRRRIWGSRVRTLGDGCVLREGHVDVVAVPGVHEDPAGWLRGFRHALREGVRVSPSSVARLSRAVAEPGEVPWTPDAREVFVDILRWGPASIEVLETIDRSGLLEALIPEWRTVRCLPQRDLYHRYTVDMHLFTAVAELTALRASSEEDVVEAWSRVGEATSLTVALFLHDAGKCRGGDHSAVGAELAGHTGRRMGLTADQVEEVVFLVRDHLTLADLATHRDIADPKTVRELAGRAGSSRRLAMLYLHTRADALATGPEAWSTFRAALIGELYGRTLRFMEEGVLEPERAPPVPPQVTELGPREVRMSVERASGHDEVRVVTADRYGLFATVCGVFALRGIDVHAAEVSTVDGIAVESFHVRGAHGPVPDERWERVRMDLAAALEGRLDVDAALRKKAAHGRRPRLPTKTAGVHVDEAASDVDTVIEVRSGDRLGLLRDITKALADAGCDLRMAKVATYGNQVVDVFYIRDTAGRPIRDAARLAGIRTSLEAAVGSVPTTR